MLCLVIAAALAPNTGVAAAQSSCPYGNCSTPPTPFFQTGWGYATIAGIIAAVVLALLAIMLLMRRQRQGGMGGEQGGQAETPAEEAPAEEAPAEGAPAPLEPPSLDESLEELEREVQKYQP